MPKTDPFSPKGIANRIKSKGLQKLRWYCQMCQKQCRDENGFRSHTQSESHQRQMRLFADHHDKYLNDYSRQFLGDFLRILSTRFGTKRVFANQVYQAYIADRHHVHLNATRWTALAGLVRFLGRTKICEVDETEKGWYIKWIDKSPEVLARRMAEEKKEKQELDDEQRERKRLRELVHVAKQQAEVALDEEDERLASAVMEDLDREKATVGEDGKIRLDLSLKPVEKAPTHDAKETKVEVKLPVSMKMAATPAKRVNPFKALEKKAAASVAPSDTASVANSKPKMTAMEEIRLLEEEKKRRFGNGGSNRYSTPADSHKRPRHD